MSRDLKQNAIDEACNRHHGIPVHVSNRPRPDLKQYFDPYSSNKDYSVYIVAETEVGQGGTRLSPCPLFTESSTSPSWPPSNPPTQTFIVALQVVPNSRLYNFLQRRRWALQQGLGEEPGGEHYFHLTLFQCEVGRQVNIFANQSVLNQIYQYCREMFSGPYPLIIEDRRPEYTYMGDWFYARRFQVQNPDKYRRFINRMIRLIETADSLETTHIWMNSNGIRFFQFRLPGAGDPRPRQISIPEYYCNTTQEMMPHISIYRNSSGIPFSNPEYWCPCEQSDVRETHSRRCLFQHLTKVETEAVLNPKLELTRNDRLDITDGLDLELALSTRRTDGRLGYDKSWSSLKRTIVPAGFRPTYISIFYQPSTEIDSLEFGSTGRRLPVLSYPSDWRSPPRHHTTLVYLATMSPTEQDEILEQYYPLLGKSVPVHIDRILDHPTVRALTVTVSRFVPRHPFTKPLHITLGWKSGHSAKLAGELLSTGTQTKPVYQPLKTDGTRIEGVWTEGRIGAVFGSSDPIFSK